MLLSLSVDEGWLSGTESLICIFVPGVTQANEEVGSVQPLPLFSLFPKPSTISKIIDEILKVNANEDTEGMDLCDITQGTSPTPYTL